MKRYLLLSAVSMTLCGIIGCGWTIFIVKIFSEIYIEDTILVLLLMLAATFAAVGAVYCISEKVGRELGFSSQEFFLWFALIPFGITLAVNLLTVNHSLPAETIVWYYAQYLSLMETVAYIMVIIFYPLRLLARRIFTALKLEGESNGNNS